MYPYPYFSKPFDTSSYEPIYDITVIRRKKIEKILKRIELKK